MGSNGATGALLVVTALISLGCGAVLADEDEPALISGYQERSRIDVVEAWPFVVRPHKQKHREHCELLGPADLRVTENGRPVRVVSIVQAQIGRAHV